MKYSKTYDVAFPLIDKILEENARHNFLCKKEIAHYLCAMQEAQKFLEGEKTVKSGLSMEEICDNWVEWWSARYTMYVNKQKGYSPRMKKYVEKYNRIRKIDPTTGRDYYCYKLKQDY